MAVKAEELKVGQVVEVGWAYHHDKTIHIRVDQIYPAHLSQSGFGVGGFRVSKDSGKQIGTIYHEETVDYVIRIVHQPEEVS